MRKQANRVNFNQVEEEFLDGDETVGLGVLGSKGQGGALRVAARTQKQKITAATAKKWAKQQQQGGRSVLGGTRTAGVSGLSSSLAFTPVQVRCFAVCTSWSVGAVLHCSWSEWAKQR